MREMLLHRLVHHYHLHWTFDHAFEHAERGGCQLHKPQEEGQSQTVGKNVMYEDINEDAQIPLAIG